MSVLAYSYSKPSIFTSGTLIHVLPDYVETALVADLLRQTNDKMSARVLSEGLLELSYSAQTAEAATNKLISSISDTRLKLTRILPDYSARIASVEERRELLLVLLEQSGSLSESLEERVSITVMLNENARELLDLQRIQERQQDIITVLDEPVVPKQSQPRLITSHLGAAAAVGLLMGAIIAIALYNRRSVRPT